jgi:CheY-like chemotaxis protein
VGQRVLIVEDDADSRTGLKALIETWGHKVEAARDGVEGLARARRFRPDVVVFDLALPKMDGCAMAKALRERGGTCPALIVYTGCVRDIDRQQATEAGIDVFLTKPDGLDELEGLLATPNSLRRRARGDSTR